MAITTMLYLLIPVKLSEPKNGQQFCQTYLREQACHIHKTKEYWGITSSKAFSFERSVDFKAFISV
jgi:hypothetical protein